MNLIQAFVSVLSAFGLLGLILILAFRKYKTKAINAITTLFIQKLESKLPEILESVGLSVAEQIRDMIKQEFLNPNVKRFFSHIGTEGGEVKTNKALVSRVSNTILDQYPAAKMVLDRLNITPEEGLTLLNDPTVGPLIRQALGQLTAGLGGKANKQTGTDVGQVFKIG